MKKIILIMLIFSGAFSQAQITISGVTMPKKVKVGKTELVLNGAGLREKFWIDLYVGGLYVKTKTNDANKIINADETASIKLHIISSLISSKKMTSAIDEGFEKSTKKNIEPLKKEIADFKDAFKEEIKVNDIYDIFYVPNKGTIVLKNGKLVKKIPGLAFKKALFGIWLCDDPADEDLKEGMLGKED